jgi:CelD/BcsL family acetyltransferase involved in cellulose biosynthesis
VTVLAESDELREIEPEWRALAVGRGNAFLTPEWFRSWLTQYGAEHEPLVCALREDGGRLRGLLALALARSGRPRTCTIAGANLGDQFHPVAAPGDEVEVAAAAGRDLAELRDRWSVLVLDHVERERPWVEALTDATGIRLRRRRNAEVPLPLIDLEPHGSWSDYLASRSSNLRRQAGNLTRRAERNHALVVRRTREPGELDRDVRTLFDLHDRRFAARGGTSLASERTRSFHRDFAGAALRQGWLRLWFLELDGRPVAAWYGWLLGGRYAYYNGGFDPDYSAARPGFVLHCKVIEAALEEGAAEYDFLLGDEPYKQRFANRSRTVEDVTVAPALPHPAGIRAMGEASARRLGRRIPPSMRRRLALDRLARRTLLKGRAR